MPRIFISHSSRDNAEAKLLIDWLRANGFEQLFLDIDKHAGIRAGVDWERTLYTQISRSTAVMLLLTKNWHESKWCFVEFAQARALGKDIIPVLVSSDGEQFIGDSLQQINLTENRDDALQSLLHRLHEIGMLSPEGFSLGPGRSPFPGLLSFDRNDAAIYFGRSDLVRDQLTKLEQLRIRGGERLLLLHSESGSGKSSLLKAGLLPQLERRKNDWISLPAFRPGLNPISELRFSLITALGSDQKTCIDELLEYPTVKHARAIIDGVHDHQDNHQATVLFAIDQFEELLTLASPIERSRFVKILEALLDSSLRTLAVATVRTAELSDIHNAFSISISDQLIGSFPLDRLSEIIRKPAQVAGLTVDDRLIAAIVRDTTSPDMLPLVAFMLRQLYDHRGEDYRLTLGDYQSLGDARDGLSPLETCVRAAADHAITRVKPTDVEIQALRETFVAGLVRVDDHGQFVRKPMPAERIDEAASRLIEALIEDRLLVRRGSTVDVAHEAIFKVWPFLRDLLAEEMEFLQGMTQLCVSVSDYLRLPANSRYQALLTGLRLSRNETWLKSHPTRFDEQQRKYIVESIAARDLAIARRHRLQRNIVAASISTTVLFAFLGCFAWFQRDMAETQRIQAESQKTLAEKATIKAVDAEKNTAIALAESQEQRQKAEEQGYFAAITAASAKINSNQPGLARDLLDSTAKSQRRWEWGYLRGICDTSIAVLRGHKSSVNFAAVSPDGTLIATASDDKTARVWNAVDGSEVSVLSGHEELVDSATFSSDGTRVVTASVDGTARIWNAREGTQVAVLRGHEEFSLINSVENSPDGELIVTAGDDKTARVWDARNGSEIAVLQGHEDAVMYAAFNAGSNLVVTASDDKTARVWETSNGSEVAQLHGHTESLISAQFSRDGKRIVTASWDGTARVWDARNGSAVAILRGHEDDILCTAFSPDGSRIVTASADRTARVWDPNNGSEIALLRGHEDAILSTAFSPDGSRIVTASADRTARVWDSNNGSEIALLRGHEDMILSTAFSPEGSRIVTASADGTARVWNTQVFAPRSRQEIQVRSAAISPDRTRIVTTAFDNIVHIWNAQNGSEIAVLNGHKDIVASAAFSPDSQHILTVSSDKTARVWNSQDGSKVAELRGHSDWISTATFSPDGKQIVTASGDHTARIWDARDGTELAVLRGHQYLLKTAQFSPDGKRIVTASGDKSARVWDATNGSEVALLKGHEDIVLFANFSPDGSRIVTGSTDKTVRVWDAREGAQIKVLRLHSDIVLSAVFNLDNKRILTTDEGTARVWDARDGSELVVLRGHESLVLSAAFSPDGTRIVTASDDKTARVWNAVDGSEVAVLSGHDDRVFSADFSPDGMLIFTASMDKTARIWDSISATSRYKESGLPLVPPFSSSSPLKN